MIIERKRNAIKGTFWGIIYKIIQIVFPFIIRTIIIRSLGASYLGLNSLFTAIFQVLNLAELGVSSALVFSMYRPIVENDTEKICQLMNLYKRYYRIIGLTILLVGLSLMPFLPCFIKGNVPPNVDLYILYLMHLISTVFSYWLFAYRNSLFQAHQRVDVITIIQIVINTCVYICQAILLILFHNYYLYLSLSILCQMSVNIVTAMVSKKYYPDYTPVGELPKEEKKHINQKVRDLFTAKIGTVINNSADSIVISSFIGLELLAIYQNYYYIIAAIMSLFSIFLGACTAGIGNSLIVRSKQDNKKLLYNINHFVFLFLGICCSCFVNCCQPFIRIWVGDRFVLDFSFVILFAVYLFVEEAPRTLIMFKDAGGIWRHDRFRPLISAGVNLLFNLILTPIIGLYGIILSTIASLLLIAYPWLIININKRLLNIGIMDYLIRVASYALVIIIGTVLSYLVGSIINVNSSIMLILIKLLLSFIISTTLFILAFWKTEENKYVIDTFRAFGDKLLKGAK